jgi:hypothetical protein
MKRWLSTLFKPSPSVGAAPTSPSPDQLRAWELTEVEWVREKREQMPINRLITIHTIPVKVKMELAAQGVSHIQELVQRWDELVIPTPYRGLIQSWLEEQNQSLKGQYAEFVAIKPELPTI